MTGFIEKNIFCFKKVNSTNSKLQELIAAGKIQKFSVLVAENQTGGRGQGSKSWESEKGKNLTFSLVFFPRLLKVSDSFIIAKIVSLGIVDCISLFANDVKIKWPNDIYVGTKKIAGILIENTVLKDKVTNSVCGIGLNVNQIKFSSEIPNPISLKMIRDRTFELDELLKLLMVAIEIRYAQFDSLIDMLNDDYENFLFQKGVKAYYKDKQGFFEGTIRGVDKLGQLIITDSAAKERRYFMQEVEYL